MIEKVLTAMKSGDYKGLSELFAERSNYSDFMPSTVNCNNYHVYGKKSIEMFFHHALFFGNIVIANVQLEDDKSANYLAAYHGENLHAQMKIEEVDSQGKIKRLVVRPTSGEFAKYVFGEV